MAALGCACTFLSAFRPAVEIKAAGLFGSGQDTEEQLIEIEENQEHPASEMGTVRISYMVDSIYAYKENIQVEFLNAETGEHYTVSSEKFKEDDVVEEMPEGEWSYVLVQFENEPVYGAIGCLVNQDSFTVTAGEETEIAVIVEDHQINPQAIKVDLDILNASDFDGTVQMWLEGESDAYYTDAEGLTNSSYSGAHIQERYTLRFDKNIGYSATIDAGNYSVTKIYAYNSDRQPMDICYVPSFSVSRYNDKPQIKVKIFPAGEAAEYGTKYHLQKAENTPAFAYNYYYRDVQTYRSYLGLPEEDRFAELRSEEYERLSRQEEAEYQQLMKENGDIDDAPTAPVLETENQEKTSEDWKIILLCILVGAIFIATVILTRRWEKEEDENTR